MITRLSLQRGRRYSQFGGVGVTNSGAEPMQNGAGSGFAGGGSGSLLSAVIAADGFSLTLTFSPPSGGAWGTTFTLSSDATKYPVVTVGAGGNANTLHQNNVITPAAKSSGNLVIVVRLTGRIFTGETATISMAGGYIVDDLSNSTAVVSAVSVTHTSNQSIGTAYTRMAGSPVVAWAFRDKWPFSGSQIPVALEAFDSWAGVASVDVTFSVAVTVVSAANVTNLGSNVYRITGRSWLDLCGYGQFGQYFILYVDISGVGSDGDYCTATISNVTMKDGSNFNPSSRSDGGRNLDAYTLTVRKNPVIRYVDSQATGANNGTSAANAWTTITTALANVGTTTDIVKIAPGTYSLTSPSFDQSRSDRFIKWMGDLTMTGDGSGAIVVNSAGIFTVKNFNALLNMRANITNTSGDNDVLYMSGANHVAFENFTIYYVRGKTNGAPNNVFVSHFSLINVHQIDGYRGCFIQSPTGNVESSALWIHHCELEQSGTVGTGSLHNALVEGMYAHNNCQGGFSTSTHSDFIHITQSFGPTNANYTESTKTITATGAFANMTTSDLALTDIMIVAGTGTGASSGSPNTYKAFKLVQKISNDQIVVDGSVAGGADISDSSLSLIVIQTQFNNLIMRYCRVYDNGLVGGQNYNFMLAENPGRDFACYGNIGFSYQSVQQITQMAARPRNMQFVHNTWMAFDNDTVLPADTRGFVLTGNKAAMPYDMIGVLLRNNVLHGFSSTVGLDTNQAPANYYRKRLYGPNLISSQNADGVNGYVVKDGTVKTATGGLAAFGLTSLSSPYNFMPTVTSPAYRSNYSAPATDVERDLYGVVLAGDAGAAQYSSGGGANATILSLIASSMLLMPD